MMISLKVALITASACGTIATGGAVTYAAVGQEENGGLSSDKSRLPAAQTVQKPSADLARPSCLPTPALPKGTDKLPKAKLPETPTEKLPKLPLPEEAEKLAKDLKGKVPPADMPTGVPSKLPPGTPKTLPACDKVETLPGKAPSRGVPSAPAVPGGVPAGPAVPAIPDVPCDKVPPALKVGSAVERAITLPRGLKFSSARPVTRTIDTGKLCSTAQKWTGKAGAWLTIERLKAAPKTTEDQVRKGLGLATEKGSRIKLQGTTAWQSPTGDGVLALSPEGYFLYVSGGPTFAGKLQDVAAQLRLPR